ncbi:gram domain-containing protein [Stylonychia lemnae]|uniref:Gram domain-containing protein n=1 Tax=Stylonychia lemnae TaxID=5949 RepID=A0A078A6D8_STYLE|nr:gram domain-containing protein [Stylonychia lemnae]|eukprot:CDW77825.1 gram domain-containing protein [Stylonychia lemnae]
MTSIQSSSSNQGQSLQQQQITKDNYKPFQSEKDLIQSIQNQEQEIQTALRVFSEIIPKNLKFYKEYGDRLMFNGERMRVQINIPGQDSKDLFTLLLQLSSFFETIGRLFSQNYNDVQVEINSYFNEVYKTMNDARDCNYATESLKILPKAQLSHQQIEKLKTDYEKSSKEAQEVVQKMKSVKQDPDLMYNLSVQQMHEERAQRSVQEMEEKKLKYKNVLQDLNQKNHQFLDVLEKLTKQHGLLVDSAAQSVRKMFETTVNTELIHYDSLNLLAPDKAKNIKNFQIRQEMRYDIKAAEDQSYKIDLKFARQKIQDLPEGAINHQQMAPCCQYVSDTAEFYGKVTDKWTKYLTALLQFITEQSQIEKNMSKQFKEIMLSDKKKKELQLGGFQSAVFELLRTAEIKEKNHVNYQRYIETLVGKLEQIVKNYKSDEKTFQQGIQRISRDLMITNEKTGKQTLQFERQLVKISQQLSQNFSNKNDDRQNTQFQALMIEYQQLTDVLKETYNNFKAMLLLSIDQQYELVKTFKDSQITHIRQIYGVVCGLTSFEETFLNNQQQLNKDFLQYVKIMDTDNIYEQFKCQIMNKHQIEFVQQQQEKDIEQINSYTGSKINDEFNEDQSVRSQGQQPNSQNQQLSLTSQQLNNNFSSQQQNRAESFDAAQLSINNQNTDSKNSYTNNKSQNATPQRRNSNASSNSRNQSQTRQGRQDQDDRSGFKSPNFQQYNEIEEEKQQMGEIDEELQSIRINQDKLFQSELLQNDQMRQPRQSNMNLRPSVANKGSKSFQVQMTGTKSNGVSPYKRQLDQYMIKEELEVDEDLKKEIEKLKNAQISPSHQELMQATPNSKFLFEKFSKLEQDEKFLESFACALNQKILLQGRLYLTTKRICFHSYFNDKTLFGKETKIQIYYTNVLRINKKTNAMVFDNSISVTTKEDKEIFFTSFVYRDVAVDLIQKQLQIINGVIPPSAEGSRCGSMEDKSGLPSQSNQGGNDSGSESDNEGDDEEIKEDDENDDPKNNEGGEGESKPAADTFIFDNAKLNIDTAFTSAENERLNRVKQLIPDFDKFNLLMIDETIDCSLKHFAQVFINFDIKWPHLENLSLAEWLEKYPLTNIDLNFNVKSLNMPDYFSRSEVPQPLPSEFQSWPLSCQFKLDLTHCTEKPKFMQPKTNKCMITCDNYLISPRMIIRRGVIANEGFPYADSFTIEYKMTLIQSDNASTSGEFQPKLSIKSEFKINIIKPIRFIQGTVVKETESSLRECYGTGPYKESLISKVIELKKYLKERWESLPKQPLAKPKIQKKEKKSRGKSNKEPNNQVQIQQDQQIDIPQVQIQQQQLANLPQMQQINGSELQKEIQELRVNVQKLTMAIYGLLALNLLTMIITMFK